MNSRALIITFAILGLSVHAHAQHSLRLVRIGLTDPLHTDPITGEQDGGFLTSPSTDVIVGVSIQRGSASDGWSVWIADPETGATTLAGLHDAEHTTGDGGSSHDSYWVQDRLTPGIVFGTSLVYRDGQTNGQSAWRHRAGEQNSLRVGFFDTAHTSAIGERFTVVTTYNDPGDSVGWSRRYVGGAWAGQSAWHLSAVAAEAVRIGLFDSLHTSQVGTPSQSSQPRLLAANGVAAGTSVLYHSGSFAPGQSAWRFEPTEGVTHRIGLLDVEHTDSSSGYHVSMVHAITPDGAVCGSSQRFANGNYRGESLWIDTPQLAAPVRLGLVDAEHTSASGTRRSSLIMLKPSGDALGTSTRWNEGWTGLGLSAWVFNFNDQNVHRLGLLDGVHTSSSGQRWSYPLDILEGGRVIGVSTRYSQNASVGNTLWLWNPISDTYMRLGFSDSHHTHPSTGAQNSTFGYVLDSRFVVGTSSRWSVSGTATAWVFDLEAGTTNILGLVDGEHVVDASGLPSSDPGISSSPRSFGQLVGGRSRRVSSIGGGTTPWFANAVAPSAMRVGFYDARHTHPTGLQETWVYASSVNLRTYGSSERFIGGNTGGETLFAFDSRDGSMLPLVFSERADGYAYAEGDGLSDDGTIIGSYREFDAETDGPFIGFIWRRDIGMRRLDDVIDGGFESAGYSLPQYENGYINFFSIGQGSWRRSADRVDRPGEDLFLLFPVPCAADFDGNGTRDVPDIFAFLSAWFAQNEAAEFDGVAGIAVPDIFAYLSLWFAGCD